MRRALPALILVSMLGACQEQQATSSMDSTQLTLAKVDAMSRTEARAKLGEVAEDDPLSLDSLFEAVLLVLQRLQEVGNPWLPVRDVGSDCALSLAQGEVIGFLALLDDVFQRAIGHVGITGSQQQQGRQYSR